MMRAIIEAICLSLLVVFFFSAIGHSRDPGGKYAKADPKMHDWFESLSSGKGPCCSDADGTAVSDADWESQNKPNSHYRVRIENEWWDVPDEAVLTQPNLYGRTVVWPIRTWDATKGSLSLSIRCFIVGPQG